MSDPEHGWHELRFTVEPEAAEAVEFALNSLDASGTAIDLMPTDADTVCVVGYFTTLPDQETIRQQLRYALTAYKLREDTVLSVESGAIENEDWLAEWKKHWKPTTIGNFVIAAPWHEVDELEKVVIRIEPNMAFGTGTHETTQLCLKAIDELYERGDSFLDVGTGTGILAIAAALRSNRPQPIDPDRTGGNLSDSEGVRILGFDTDSDAVKIACENAELNGVGSEIKFQIGPVDESTPTFDFVSANLTLDVILPILPLLLSKARNYLILSGILKTQEPDIIEQLENLGCREFTIEAAVEWIAVIIRNEN